MEQDFSYCFKFNYNQYDHYLDAVLNKIDPFPDSSIIQVYTSLAENLFIPTWITID